MVAAGGSCRRLGIICCFLFRVFAVLLLLCFVCLFFLCVCFILFASLVLLFLFAFAFLLEGTGTGTAWWQVVGHRSSPCGSQPLGMGGPPTTCFARFSYLPQTFVDSRWDCCLEWGLACLSFAPWIRGCPGFNLALGLLRYFVSVPVCASACSIFPLLFFPLLLINVNPHAQVLQV